jgi:hypothetical protein
MREIFTYGSVGGASGDRCFYPEPDGRPVSAFSVWQVWPPVNLVVSAPSEAWCFLQGASPCRAGFSQPPVSSVA